MIIHFGENEYTIVPSTQVQEVNNDMLQMQILADEVSFSELETVLSNSDNIKVITVTDTDELLTYFNYIKLISLNKMFNETFEINDSESITVDVIHIVLQKPDLADQVAENTANIEFIAIMSDIELE